MLDDAGLPIPGATVRVMGPIMMVAQEAFTDPEGRVRIDGLPPGPIASPGLPSIRAALRPEASSALFYLHGDDGLIRYANTNDEHNANRAKYLK